MDTDDTAQSPTATPAPAPVAAPPAFPPPADGIVRPADPTSHAPIGERVLDLTALLLLIALAAAVFVLAGPAAFTAVTSAGVGLFVAWRSRW
ncbi:hypothetical protein ACIQF6_17395 [Kitasatospora sp. NPDC092948]|uniref:hypothetical protein n=1 Tax=Kitasatospora sp. NPDC092948 TaxID=3364088 RepID=UPI0037FAD3D6